MTQKFQTGQRCIIRSKTSHQNGRIVTVKYYTKGKRQDILMVEARNGKTFLITEASLQPATRYDEIRNLKNHQIDRLLQRKKKEKHHDG